jgi:hypothetical protein
LNQAASLATGFGQMAVDFQKSKQGTADAKQKLSNIQKAKDTGLIDDTEAKHQASDALAEQNMSAASQPLTDTPPINSALEKAGSTGQPIEVTQQNQTGTETVKVGAAANGGIEDFRLLRLKLAPQARDLMHRPATSAAASQSPALLRDHPIRAAHAAHSAAHAAHSADSGSPVTGHHDQNILTVIQSRHAGSAMKDRPCEAAHESVIESARRECLGLPAA